MKPRSCRRMAMVRECCKICWAGVGCISDLQKTTTN